MNCEAIIVNTDVDLNRLCEHWAQGSFIGLDTEFIRTNTFYAKIGLLQISDAADCYLVDPLLISDWGAFTALLSSDITVVIHSCSEDLGLLYSFLGVTPGRVFDTQLAAAFLNMGFSLSYQKLVLLVLAADVSKDETRSDWLRRPLTEQQLAYAAADVYYLPELFKQLHERLTKAQLLDWFNDDCKRLGDIARLSEDEAQWQSAYLGLSNAWKLSLEQLSLLQKLCFWREQTARKRDKPKSWVAKDNDLFAIAEQLSLGDISVNALYEVNSVDERLLERNAASMHRIISGNDKGYVALSAPIKPLSAPGRKLLKQCQQIANEKANSLQIAAELLSRKRLWLQLLHLTADNAILTWPEELNNWRRPLLEEQIAKVFSATDQLV